MQVDWCCSIALCLNTVSVVSAGFGHRNEVNSIAWLYIVRLSQKIVSFTLHYIHLDVSKPTKPTPEIPYRLLSLIHQEPSKGFPFLHTLTALCPCISHMSVHHPYFCNHSPSNTCSNPLVPCNPSPQHNSKRLIVVSSMAYEFMILIW